MDFVRQPHSELLTLHERGDGHLGEPTSSHSPSATPTTQTVESSSSSRSPNVISHKVTKRDTLAGLAIRYNVSVGDIKRANGLLSDNALYARDVIQIPTGGLQLGEEVQLIFAQVATGFGRDPVLNAEANLQPASAAAARVARTLNIINGHTYPPEDGERSACRSSQRLASDSEDELQEYELQERHSAGPGAGGEAGGGQSDGPTRMHGRMRRRKAHAHDDPGAGGVDGDSDEGEAAPLRGPRAQNGMRAPRPMAPMAVSAGAVGSPQGDGIQTVMRHLTEFGKVLGDMNIMQRIRAVASQPALAGPNKHSLTEAAEGVLHSFTAGLLSRRSVGPGSGVSSLHLPPLPPSSHAGSETGAAGPPVLYKPSKTGAKND